MSDRPQQYRAEIVCLMMLLGFFLLAIRLFDLQCLQHPGLSWLAHKQQQTKLSLPAPRARILDSNFKPLAISVEAQSLYAEPVNIPNKKEIAKKLASALKLDPPRLAELLQQKSTRKFIWVKRKLKRSETDQVLKLELQGVGLRSEFQRFYPMKALACQTVGFCDIDNQGLEGIELSYNRLLTGKPGYRIVEQDGRRQKLFTSNSTYQPPKAGKDLVLTIDSVIQHLVETEIAELVATWDPVAVTAIVMRPHTGEVLALANSPSFDLNHFNTTPARVRLNRAVATGYEPGSTFKPFLAAALLQERLANIEDSTFCHNGSYQVPGIRRTIRDVHGYGRLTLREVVVKSSNIGMTKFAQRLSPKMMHAYVRRFGFGEPTGIELPGEIAGWVTPVSRWSRYTSTSVPYGYELLVTPLQLLAAFNVFANGGIWIKPTTIKGFIDNKGKLVTPHQIQIRTVLSTAVARQMLDPILTGVVNQGTGKRARLTDYQIAGKTGTTRKAGRAGYSQSQYLSSFVCCAPAENPRISVLVMVNEPRQGGSYYGGTVAAPSASRIVEATLDYLYARPEQKQSFASQQLVWSEDIDRYH